MHSILVLGAGFVAAPLVDYLTRKDYQITIASHLLAESEAIANNYEAATAIQLDVSNNQALSSAIRAHDMVVSFVPFVFHEQVAEACIAESRSLVTASYETEKMRSLDAAAKQAGVTIINEIGLDPGIDHLSARKLFDDIHAEGEALESFVSWCGGIPAVSANNNPLGYKFSWSPKSVLLAILNDAKYINDGQEQIIPAAELLTTTETVKVSDELELEGYANRDSTSYVDSYNIPEAKKVLRGTLRFPGFCEIMQLCKNIGLLDQTDCIKDWQGKDWVDYILSNAEKSHSDFTTNLSEVEKGALDYLGLLREGHAIPDTETILDAFCALLTEKLAYADDESDMVVMQHQFQSRTASGEQLLRTSTLVLEGEPKGFSAMAKTVGTPAAIMVDMIMTQEFTETGVLLPMTAAFYGPMLPRLAVEGIELVERTYTIGAN